MILAGVILKLGTYGIFRLKALLVLARAQKDVLLSLGLLGAIFSGLICTNLTDFKAIIAFSSVGHMRVAFTLFTLMAETRILAMLVIILSHSFSSAWLFYNSFYLYTRSHSRRILLNKGAYFKCKVFSIT